VDFAEILGRLAEATDQELSQALAAIAAEAGTLAGQPATAQSTQRTMELRDAAKAFTGERTRRQEMASNQAAALAELSELTAQPAEPATEPQPTEPTAPQPTQPTTPDPTAPAEPTAPTPVTAGASRPVGGVQTAAELTGNHTTAPARPRANHRTVALPGSGLADGALNREQIAEAFARKLNERAGAGSGRLDMLRVMTEFPEERTLRSDVSAFNNRAKVEAVSLEAARIHAMENLVAAGGLCAPMEPLYDIPVVGVDDRPVQGALARFGADRGGITFRPALDAVTQTGGIAKWTVANDSADPLVDKTCVEFSCPGVLTEMVEATYLCLEFSNMTSRFDPEWADSVIQAQRVAHARFSENDLLTKITTGSKVLYTTKLLGATRDILATLDKVTAYYRNVHRLGTVALRAILPLWARNLMRADIVRQMVGDGLETLAVVDAVIDDWFARRNVNVTWHLDGINPADLTTPEPDVVTAAQFYTLAAAQSLVPGFPDTVTMNLFPEGDWLLLDGGELNLGIVRDSTLNARNRYQLFSESFQQPVFRGVESLVIHMQVQPTGESAATVATASVAD
jgi:hypothetical protein